MCNIILYVSGSERVDYMPTSNNVANIFTKALPREPFIKFCSMLVVSRTTANLIAYAKPWEHGVVVSHIVHFASVKCLSTAYLKLLRLE